MADLFDLAKKDGITDQVPHLRRRLQRRSQLHFDVGSRIRAAKPLYEFCDAGLHLDCLVVWPHRMEFSKVYFDGARQFAIRSGTLLLERKDWILRRGPAQSEKAPYYAEVDLVDWPFRLYSRFEHWDSFIAGAFREQLEGPALTRAEEVMREVTAVAPTLSKLRMLRTQATTERAPNQ